MNATAWGLAASALAHALILGACVSIAVLSPPQTKRLEADFTLEKPGAAAALEPPPLPKARAVVPKPEPKPEPVASQAPKLQVEKPTPTVEPHPPPAPPHPPAPAPVAVAPEPEVQRAPAPSPTRLDTTRSTAGGRIDRGPEGGPAAGSAEGTGGGGIPGLSRAGGTGVSDAGLARGSGPRGEGGNGTGLGGYGGAPGGSRSEGLCFGRGTDPASQGARYSQEHLGSIRGLIAGNFRYPPLARRLGWMGRVTVEFVVRGDGSVEDIRVVKSSGVALLDSDAEETVSRSAPFPRPPVSVRLIIPVEYVLK